MRGEPYAHVSDVPVLCVYGNRKVHSFYDAAMVYDDTTNLKDRVHFQEVTEFTAFVTNDGYTVTPVPATHDRNENCLLYLIEKGGKTLFYANDSGLFPESTWEFLKGKHLDLVNFDCTCILEKDGKNHMGLPDNIEAKERLYALGCVDNTTKCVVTHFSHNYKLMHAEIEEAVGKYGFIPAFDGMELEI